MHVRPCDAGRVSSACMIAAVSAVRLTSIRAACSSAKLMPPEVMGGPLKVIIPTRGVASGAAVSSAKRLVKVCMNAVTCEWMSWTDDEPSATRRRSIVALHRTGVVGIWA